MFESIRSIGKLEKSSLAVHAQSWMWIGAWVFRLALLGTLVGILLTAQTTEAPYILGPGDVVAIRVLDLEEFNAQSLPPLHLDNRGDLHLPLIGRLHVAGLTAEQLEVQVHNRLANIMLDPEVNVVITEFRNHPVSVLGAVRNPGVYQINGKRTLFEVLSLAGGLSPDAGNLIKITRRVEFGPLPLQKAQRDSSGAFDVGELSIRALMDAKNPDENIQVLPNDVITVPKADLVYVTGAVKRSGGFVLSEKEHISALQALSLAEGLDRAAAPKNARILRQSGPAGERTEIPVDLQRILEGRTDDISLSANDILFVPTSASKNAALRAMEAAIQLGTGIAIYHW